MDDIYFSLTSAAAHGLIGSSMGIDIPGWNDGSFVLPQRNLTEPESAIGQSGVSPQSSEIQTQVETLASPVCSILRDPLRRGEQTEVNHAHTANWGEWLTGGGRTVYEYFFPSLMEISDSDYNRAVNRVRRLDSYIPADGDNVPADKQLEDEAKASGIPTSPRRRKTHAYKKVENRYVLSVVARVHARFGHRISRAPADEMSVRRFATQLMKDDGHRDMHIARDITLVVSLSKIPPKRAIAAEAVIVIGDHDYRGEYGSRRTFRYDPRRWLRASQIPELDN